DPAGLAFAPGLSSTGAEVARALGWCHLDTGSLYRGLTRVALDAGAMDDPPAILAAASARHLHLRLDGREIVVLLDGRPAESRLRGPEIAAAVSRVAAWPEVRDWANRQFRSVVEAGGATVLDGRDIGTAVFPDAPLKIFLTASPEVRAGRRLRQAGHQASPEELAREALRLSARDTADATRAVAPLRRAPDAIEVDTSQLTLAGQVEQIVGLARRIWLP
ncbi:MAG: (d)CMP kinase, partial [Gemmatimonadales bacterium]|nr:(d)CMP kinase [Gemmatimonadales bacterium]